MTITNTQGVTSFPFAPSRLLEGMESPAGPAGRGRPVANPYRREVHTLTVGGTPANGTYSATITDEAGSSWSAAVTRTGGSPATNNDLAAALVTALLGVSGALGLWYRPDGVTRSSAVVTARFRIAGRVYTIATSAPAGATLAWSRTTAAAGLVLPVGRLVKTATVEGMEAVALLENSDTADAIMGAIVRPHTSPVVRLHDPGPGDGAVYRAPHTVDMRTTTLLGLRNRGSVAASPGGLVYAVRNDAGGQDRGAVRADADGSNTVVLPVGRARWVDAVPVGEVGLVELAL